MRSNLLSTLDKTNLNTGRNETEQNRSQNCSQESWVCSSFFFFFFSTCPLQNTAELHPFVIPCGILVLFCHVILIYLPLLRASVKHVFVCLHRSPSSPRPLYTQDFHLVGKQCVHNRKKQQQQQSGVLSWDELCSSSGEGCSLLTEGRNRGSKRQQKAGVGERQKKAGTKKKASEEGGHDKYE